MCLQATQNQPQHRFHWHGELVLLCSVMVFKWVCISMAEIQVCVLSRRHTDCFGWRNGRGWLVQWVRAWACVQMLLIAQNGTSSYPPSQLSYTVSGCKDLFSYCIILVVWLRNAFCGNEPFMLTGLSFMYKHILGLSIHQKCDLKTAEKSGLIMRQTKINYMICRLIRLISCDLRDINLCWEKLTLLWQMGKI